jgi:hypothetical protein
MTDLSNLRLRRLDRAAETRQRLNKLIPLTEG